ncbi:WG repeat-containing protein [Clostridium sp. DSM 100503]|uniref:WG repeat-containing protein n=1 Tax=unclassified Clostridium TaxID=2614128 RepID=UPI001897E6FD|nr:WG repeat-containing protein [Clostridium sp. DSM 100503]MCR1951155.1 WG repeat-containing protein [Clostridium sp. DSM 100503]
MNSNKNNKVESFAIKNRINSEKLYPALRNTKEGKTYGYINSKGVFIIDPIYSSAYDFNSSGLAIVGLGERFGVINKNGEFVLKPVFDSIREFKENRAIWVYRDYMGVINEKGNIITNKKYSFISDYSEGRAIVGFSNSNGSYRYGYIDLEGYDIIPTIYLEANNFNEGVALVKLKENEYRLINPYGQVVNTYTYNYISQYGDGLMVFGNSFEGPLGYINIAGQVIIKPRFKSAQGFRDGVAIVSESDSFQGPYGLIDKTGKYVYEANFSDIKILGEGRVALGIPIGDESLKLRSIYAIGDTNGNRLTEFIYLAVSDYNDGLAYVSDKADTFFIDLSGNREVNLPKVSGSGELSIKSEVVYANIDYSPYYLDKSGRIIYKSNDIIYLDNRYSILKEKYKPNISYLIYIPEVQGIKDKNVEIEINNKLRSLSYFNPNEENGSKDSLVITENDVLNYDYYGDFRIKYFNNNLLVLEIEGYYYPLGAAHGMPYRKTPTINLLTGNFYTLGDLFMGGVYWVGELNKIISNMIQNDKQYEYVFKDQFKGIKEDQDFYVDSSNLYIYFPPYEIGPYSAGFITFKIPFSEIHGMINKSGDFYKALQA